MKIYAWKTGASLAIAVGIGYAILSLLFAMWPLAGTTFHEAIQTGAGISASEGLTKWSFSSFSYALALLVVWGFATGALFAWVHTFLHRSDV